jgi:hypothetical protein
MMVIRAQRIEPSTAPRSSKKVTFCETQLDICRRQLKNGLDKRKTSLTTLHQRPGFGTKAFSTRTSGSGEAGF